MNIQSIDFEDLVQDVLLKLWKGLDSYDKEKSKFRTWLSHVTRNTVLSYFRTKKRRPQGVDLESEESAVNKYFSELSDNQLEEMFEKESCALENYYPQEHMFHCLSLSLHLFDLILLS